MDRRTFLSVLALGAAGVACSRPGRRGPLPPFRGLADDLRGAEHGLNVFLGGMEHVAGPDERVSLGLVDPDGFSVEGGAPRIWVGRGEEANGPYPATFRRYRQRLPEDPAGFFLTRLPLDDAGIATVLVEHGRTWGTATMRVLARPTVPGVGARAVPVATPTFGRPRGVEVVCTRLEGPCPMHEVRLDRVLGMRPVVLTIASPKHCASRTCGPVVEEITDARVRAGEGAAFIHAEPFATDGPFEFSATAAGYRLESEPWTFVIDGEGIIRSRFEGPLLADEVTDALRAVL